MPSELAAGTTIGAYRVIAPIGRGGMGGVWEVEDARGTRLALKAPVADLEGDSEAARRFAREVNAQRALDHPNLVAGIDAFVVDGALYLVMERVHGETLGRILRQGAPLAPRRALAIGRQILAGLAHAHGLGVAHRDLKPDNVMLVRAPAVDGAGGTWEQAKLLDFGMVKLMGDAAQLFGGDKLTRTGMVQGTPQYMAPEQALGRIVDGRVDLYALGVILFEMLVGRPLFAETDPVALMKLHVKQAPPRLDEVAGGQPWCTPAVVALVAGALQKDPAQRYADAAAMIVAIEQAFASIDRAGASVS